MPPQAGSAGSARPQRWIFGPVQDTVFVLGTPVAILAVVAAARAGRWTDGLVAFGVALAMGHYLPGMLRAYGDPVLFRRFRVRLIVAPLLLGTVTTAFAVYNLHAVVLLALFWGAWHWAMQIYGFGRIYDARAGSVDPTTARLDRAICVLWFVAAVYALNDGLSVHVANAYRSGVPLLPPGAIDTFRTLWIALTAIVTLLYVLHTARRFAAGQRPNPLKLVFLLTSFAYLAFTESVTDVALVGYVMFESWHDIQYLAFTWQFTASRTRRAPGAGRLLQALFRPGALPVLGYLALCLAFGMLTHSRQLFDDPTAVRVAAALVVTVAMLHYYLDGFIWKVRERETQETLGIQPIGARGSPLVPASPLPGWARHAALWALFVVPVAGGLYLETRGKGPRESEIRRSIAELFPSSPGALADRGFDLAEMGRFRDAEVHLERAVALEPALYRAHLGLAVLPGDDPERGLRHAAEALRLRPRDPQSHHVAALAHLTAGDRDGARARFERVLELDPTHAEARSRLAELETAPPR